MVKRREGKKKRGTGREGKGGSLCYGCWEDGRRWY